MVLLAVALGLPMSARAANKKVPTTEPHLMGRLDRALSGMDLTADQKQQIEQVKAEAAETMRPMLKGLKNLPPEERRQKVQEALSGVRDQLKSILTPDQMQQLQTKLQSERRGGGEAFQQNAQIAPKDAPSTQPSEAPADTAKRGRRAQAGGPMLQRLGDALGKLDLTADQKTKTDALLADVSEKMTKIREGAKDDQPNARQQARQVMQDLRTQLQSILTPPQQQKLAQELPRLRNEGGPRNKADRQKDAPPANAPSNTNTTAAKAAGVSSSDSDTALLDGPTKLSAGDAAPDFKLYRLSEGTVSLHNFAGDPLVLIFASYSSPSFRDQAKLIDALRMRYRFRTNFLIVYTREAHAVGEWEVQRNADDGVQIQQPKTLAQRLDLAIRARRALNLATDMVVDDMDNTTAKAYDLGSDGAVVISPQGKIVGTQQWCDPYGLAPMIDAALRLKAK